MRYNKIRKMDISNGPGVRVSIFLQGCTFNCPGCFNPETHDFNGGKEFTDETIERVLELAKADHIVGLSILGGEPMHPRNIDGTGKLAKAFKEKYPSKDIDNEISNIKHLGVTTIETKDMLAKLREAKAHKDFADEDNQLENWEEKHKNQEEETLYF